jgi:hypothetical protein
VVRDGESGGRRELASGHPLRVFKYFGPHAAVTLARINLEPRDSRGGR